MHSFVSCVCLSLTLAIAACAPAPRADPGGDVGTATVRLADGVIVSRDHDRIQYTGSLNDEGYAALRQVADGRPISTLVIESAGGEIVVGMDFGIWVHDRGIDVEVETLCLSSCANYVFTAGRRKTIRPGAVVAWHGSAQQPGLLEELDEVLERRLEARTASVTDRQSERKRLMRDNRAYMAAAIEKQTRFFQTVGVDEYVTRVGNEEYGAPGFFFLSVEDMAHFGIADVFAPSGYAEMKPAAIRRRTGFWVTLVKLKPL